MERGRRREGREGGGEQKSVSTVVFSLRKNTPVAI